MVRGGRPIPKENPMADVPSAGSINVVLEGGPAEIAMDLRTLAALPADGKIKILHYGGYEHFELTDEPVGSSPAVFRWTARTKIAE
jgi:hypothetical protein